jgi:hypothetical protein
MITAAQIAPLRATGEDYDETEQLREKFAHVRVARHPLLLTKTEFEDIVRWKLRGQYVRQRALREANTEALLRAITGLALTIRHPDPDYELDVRVGLLCTLRGVGVPVASAVLGLVYPGDYAVIDTRGWRQICGGDQATFALSEYKRYLREARRLADELDWPVQDVDLALWEYDRQQGAISASSKPDNDHNKIPLTIPQNKEENILVTDEASLLVTIRDEVGLHDDAR